MRRNNIVRILQIWFTENSHRLCVVCLQEVNEPLLNLLIEVFGTDRLAHTSELDSITFISRGETRTELKKEYRVTILSENLILEETKDIELKNSVAIKNGLLCKIILPNAKQIKIINLHMHWRSDFTDLDRFGKSMKLELGYVPYIICGDFNKTMRDIASETFFMSLGDENIQREEAIDLYNPISFTSADTRRNPTGENVSLYEGEFEHIKMATIDHIVISNIIFVRKPQIISNIN